MHHYVNLETMLVIFLVTLRTHLGTASDHEHAHIRPVLFVYTIKELKGAVCNVLHINIDCYLHEDIVE